jgi:flagellar hook-associated protein 1 FlgK
MGTYDAFNISRTGIDAQQINLTVTSNNVANASNENYTRQKAILATNASIYDGKNFIGQGVNVADIIRVRDTLLDDQIRNALSETAFQTTSNKWLTSIESIYNEPSETGIQNALTQFWTAWSQLTDDPESFATRSNIMTQTNNLTTLIQKINGNLESFQEQIDQAIIENVDGLNSLVKEIANLNDEIFEIESGSKSKANDLRDQRDSALDALSEIVPINYSEDSEGMVQVFIGNHPLIWKTNYELLETKTNPLQASDITIEWEWGDTLENPSSGSLGGLVYIKDTVVQSYIENIDTFSSNLIENINEIYSNGVGSEGLTFLTSNLGYEALGVSSSTQALNLVEEGEYAALHFSFYDSQNEITQMASIIVDSEDSLSDITQLLSSIAPLNASLIADTNNDDRLSIGLQPNETNDSSKPNQSYTISNNTEGYDTSGFTSLLQFDNPYDKTSNIGSVGDQYIFDEAPTLISSNTNNIDLATTLGVLPSEVTTTALNISGTFTLNLFESVTQVDRTVNGTESSEPSDWTVTDQSGFNIQQFTLSIDSNDTMESIRDKINNLNSTFGLSNDINSASSERNNYEITASINGDATNGYTFSITTSAVTDSNGNLTSQDLSETFSVQLSFANTYNADEDSNDQPPTNYTGLGDDTDLLATMQFNTLLEGSNASDIQLDEGITHASQINAGTKLASGNNTLALMMSNLQFERIIDNNQFTLNEEYENIVTNVGNDVALSRKLASNEETMLEGFIQEKQSISGVNLDEELANMIQYEKAYQANTRMFLTLSNMADELLNLFR